MTTRPRVPPAACAGLPAVMIGVFPEKAIKLGVNESIRDVRTS